MNTKKNRKANNHYSKSKFIQISDKQLSEIKGQGNDFVIVDNVDGN